jgi:hypothetical protein
MKSWIADNRGERAMLLKALKIAEEAQARCERLLERVEKLSARLEPRQSYADFVAQQTSAERVKMGLGASPQAI